MTPATKQSPRAELHRLNAKREQALEHLRELKAKAEEWNMALLPAPVAVGSFDYDQAAARREREEGPNPYAAELEEARTAFLEADEAVTTYQTDNLDARLAEFEGEARAGVEAIREAFTSLLRASEVYMVAAEEARGVVVTTPRLDGRDLEADSRVHEWAQQARSVLDGEIALPALTDAAREKVS